MASVWQKEADKTFMNVMAQNTVASSDIWWDNAKETLSVIYRHSSVEAPSPCWLYIDIQPERVKILARCGHPMHHPVGLLTAVLSPSRCRNIIQFFQVADGGVHLIGWYTEGQADDFAASLCV
jgi:hypothetical protein